MLAKRLSLPFAILSLSKSEEHLYTLFVGDKAKKVNHIIYGHLAIVLCTYGTITNYTKMLTKWLSLPIAIL